MEAISKIVLTTIVTRLVNRHRSKIQSYQDLLQLLFGQVVTLMLSKYLFYRNKIQEKKETAFYEKFEYALLQLKDKAGYFFVKLQSMDEECVTHKDTPELFCEPHIHTGFRPLNKPYSYYLKSLLKKHNETVNALSHYIGALYCLTYFFRYDFSDPYTWPLLTSVLTAIFMFMCSASAHLMHQKSHYCHMTCFLFDFTGISLHLFGAGLLQTYYCSPTWYYKSIENVYLPFLALTSIMCCLCNCFAQTNFKRPYPPIKRIIQFAPLGVAWIFTIAPLVLVYFSNDNTSDDIQFIIDFESHAYHICLFLIGALFFGLEIPQRFMPGGFDFFGQGHHIFHICIFFTVKIQIESCYDAFISNYNHIVETRILPSVAMCFLSVFILLIYDLFIIKTFRKMISHNFDSEGNLISKKAEDQIDMDCSAPI